MRILYNTVIISFNFSLKLILFLTFNRLINLILNMLNIIIFHHILHEIVILLISTFFLALLFILLVILIWGLFYLACG